MRAVIDVNGEVIGRIGITNHGHPHSFDRPAHDDLRIYLYELVAEHRDHRGAVEHRRSDGWAELLRKVLADSDTHR